MNSEINRRDFLRLLAGVSPATGAPLDQNTYTDSNNQLWKLTATGSYDTITNSNSGLLLDDINKVTTNGSPVGQEATNDGTDQQWSVVGA